MSNKTLVTRAEWPEKMTVMGGIIFRLGIKLLFDLDRGESGRESDFSTALLTSA